MPQALLPLVPDGATAINDFFSVVREGGQWTYFLGVRPVFQHAEADPRSFRMFTAQLICQGSCLQSEVVRAFGVSAISVKRSVKRFREQGIEGFYQPRRGRGATVVTPEIAQQVQALLLQGRSRSQVAEQLGLKSDTLRKAILQGRVSVPSPVASSESRPDDCGPSPRQDPPRSPADESGATAGDLPPPPSSSPPPPTATDQSQRTVQDAAAAEGLGMACTRVLDRVAASLGLLPGGAATQFQPCRDVPFGGVMCALPALSGMLATLVIGAVLMTTFQSIAMAYPSEHYDQKQIRSEKMHGHLKARLDKLAARLEIKASQQSAWEEFAKSVETLVDRNVDRPNDNADAASVARYRADKATAYAGNMARIADATAKLQVALTEDQQKVLNQTADCLLHRDHKMNCHNEEHGWVCNKHGVGHGNHEHEWNQHGNPDIDERHEAS